MLISIQFGAEVFIKDALGQLMFNRDTMCPFAVKGTSCVPFKYEVLKMPYTTGTFISTHLGAYIFIECALGQWVLNRDTMCPLRHKECDTQVNHKSSYAIH